MENTGKAYDPGNWFWFVFAITCYLTMASYLGMFQGDNSIVMGIICIATYPLYLIAGKYYVEAGNGMIAMYCYAFGMLFGGLWGAASTITSLFQLQGIFFDYAIQGVIFLAGGIYLAITIPSMVYADKVNLITWTFCTVWCVCGGLSYLGVLADLMYMLSVVGCGITTIGVTYMMLDALLATFYYMHLPMGKPIKQMENWEQ